MDPMTVAAGISAGSSLLGKGIDLLTGKKGPSVNKQMDRAYEAMNAAAEKYGVSKLVTFGGGAPSASAPVSVGGDGIGSTLASMGQDISRAVAAGQTDAERQLSQLALEKAGLENEYLRSQIQSVRVRTAREVGPALPTGSVYPEKPTLPTRTTKMHIGVPYPTNPHFVDAQSVEDRYGDNELLSMITSLINGVADAYWNVPKPKMPKTHQYWRKWDEYSGG